MLNLQQQEKIRKRLLDRLDELRADIQRELRKYDDETYGQIADRVADPAERSVADLLVDVSVGNSCRRLSLAGRALIRDSDGACQ